jgi:hypothetical protein
MGMEPHVRELAARVRTALAAARERAAAPPPPPPPPPERVPIPEIFP